MNSPVLYVRKKIYSSRMWISIMCGWAHSNCQCVKAASSGMTIAQNLGPSTAYTSPQIYWKHCRHTWVVWFLMIYHWVVIWENKTYENVFLTKRSLCADILWHESATQQAPCLRNSCIVLEWLPNSSTSGRHWCSTWRQHTSLGRLSHHGQEQGPMQQLEKGCKEEEGPGR